MHKQTKFSSHLVLTATLSGALTIGLSLIYILLAIVTLILRTNCDNGMILEKTTGGDYFWKTVFSAFILRGDCEASLSARETLQNDITGEYTVYVLTAITLTIAILSIVTSIALITTVQDDAARYINLVLFAYIATCVAGLVVDLTTGIHFGIDHGYLSARLDDWIAGAPSSYRIEVLRHGAFLLMAIALKGFVAPLLNIILIILLIVYITEHKNAQKINEHSIHKLGALTAFDQPRKPDDNNWPPQPEMLSPFARGSQMNPGFIHDDDSPPRTPRREPSRNYSNAPYDRSDSWHHSQPSASQTARPFTYLEDVKRPMPSRPPASPSVEPWNRDQWPAPFVPAPDYSPQAARRLKSALKPAYM
ncbi:uncharacterized protein LOC113495556 [Trichoplusia ni]|uniref:Uncharacterized protein LOC113495556 n=1 Tax=Trichoplusia ni TaxID=7111 RepID=A0A7E5VP67_TRINI|nr:uncharacterized protein LOC113495556 [Trichoplusia ni]